VVGGGEVNSGKHAYLGVSEAKGYSLYIITHSTFIQRQQKKSPKDLIKKGNFVLHT